MKLKQNSIKSKSIKYYNIFLFFGLCLVSCLVSITQVFATGEGSNGGRGDNTVSNTSSANASVTVSAACSFNVTRATGHDSENGYTAILANNANAEIIGSTFTTICNDSGGYAIYAIGYGNNTLGETDLISANGSSNITSSSNPASGASYWQMKLTAAIDNQPVLENGYENYSAVPSTYTKVVSYSSITDTASSGTRTGQAVTAHYKAYVSSAQPAGTYTGAVKYTIVHPGTIVMPVIESLEYLQDFATLTETEKTNVLDSMTMETNYTLKDKRDGQEYTIAKLADGKIWMTKNLNLAGGTTLTSDTTDFDNTYTIPKTQGWQANGTLPTSSTSGFSSNNYAYVYNSNNNTDNCSGSGCYSYYSWDTATLGSGRNISTDNTDALYSICPKGWKLPTSRTISSTNWQTESDVYQLAVAYGMDPEVISEYSTIFYNEAGPGTIPNFLLNGLYFKDSIYFNNQSGRYWSSTSSNNRNNAYHLYFYNNYIEAGQSLERFRGMSIRCLAR